ncbi:hypothetical protein C7J99_28605 [Brevibacillus brevis]|nr:hypothetical protein C7J99_28605 [Brevibacillus brevis]
MSGDQGKWRLAPHDVASSKPQATRSLLGGHLPWMPCQMKGSSGGKRHVTKTEENTASMGGGAGWIES